MEKARAKAKEIIKEADSQCIAKVRPGVFLQTSEALIADQAGWDDADPCVSMDFSISPYWLTTDDGMGPIAVAGAGDDALLELLD